jgi:folate-binding protein YgfZ
MLADLEIYHRGSTLICSLASSLAPWLAERLDQLIFSENVRVSDLSAELTELSIIGTTAADSLAAVLQLDARQLAGLPELSQVDVADGFVARSGDAALPSYRAFLPSRRRDEVIDELAAAQAIRLASELIDALRIAHGRPTWGAELTPETIPLEAGLLDRAISTSKGCYVGQEIIIRILHRADGRVAKRLVCLQSEEATSAPRPGTALELVDGPGAGMTTAVSVGRVTSVAPALDSDRWIALAYVGREHAEAGRRVRAVDTGATAIITRLAG